jgi:hypothetical protein
MGQLMHLFKARPPREDGSLEEEAEFGTKGNLPDQECPVGINNTDPSFIYRV